MSQAKSPVVVPHDPEMSIKWTLTDAGDISEEIERLTGITIKPIKSPKMTTWVGVGIAVVFGFISYFCKIWILHVHLSHACRIINSHSFLLVCVESSVTAHWEGCKQFPWSRKLWLVASLTIYAGGIGGMVFCVIRRTPMWSFTRERAITLFSERWVHEVVIAVL